MGVFLSMLSRLAECLGIHNNSEETTRDYLAQLNQSRLENSLLRQENDDLKRGANFLVVSKHSLEVKFQQAQKQLCKELDSSGSYPDGSANPFLLESTMKNLVVSVSGLAKGLSLAKGPLSEHFRSLNLNPELELKTQFKDAFLSRPAHVTHMLKAWLFDIFFRNFENDSFQCGGATLLVDPNERKARSFEYLEQIKAHDPNCNALFIDSSFETFCVRKFRDILSLWQSSFVNRSDHDHGQCKLCRMYVNGLSAAMTELKFEGPTGDLVMSFVSTAKIVWALHKLCMSVEPRANIFRVQSGDSFRDEYMDCVVSKDDDENFVSTVGFMISPGFQSRKSVIKSQIYLAGPPAAGYQV